LFPFVDSNRDNVEYIGITSHYVIRSRSFYLEELEGNSDVTRSVPFVSLLLTASTCLLVFASHRSGGGSVSWETKVFVREEGRKGARTDEHERIGYIVVAHVDNA
jgi:hypothetical protein